MARAKNKGLKKEVLPEYKELNIIVRFIRYLKNITPPDVWEQWIEGGFRKWSQGGFDDRK